MPRRLRDLSSDVLALTLGLVTASWLTTTVFAARRAEPAGRATQTVSLLAPTDGLAVSGTVIVSALTGLDTDMLQFQVNGTNLGPPITFGACSMSWNTASVTDGSYSVSVVGYDGSGEAASSMPVTVTVENSAPQISGVAASGVTSASAVITWSTNQRSSSRADYGVNGYSNSVPLDVRLVNLHALTITGLAPGAAYHFRVSSTNEVGLTSTSADMAFTTAAASGSLPSGGSGGTGGSGNGGTPSNPPSSSLPAPVVPPPSTLPSAPPPAVPPPSTLPSAPPPAAPPPPSGQTIEGTVLGPSGTPLAGIRVLLLRGTSLVLTATTDAAGHFRFTGVAPGKYTALASTPDGASFRFVYDIPAG